MSDVRVPKTVLWRAWALDATWHPARMQALGVVHALAPVLRRSADPRAAAAPYTAAFNANLWMAPALLGAMARQEAEGHGADAVRTRDQLGPPLSGIGDAHVWKALRPACLVIAVAAVLFMAPRFGLVLACALYAASALRQVTHGFARGATLGHDLGRHIEAVRPSQAAGRAARSVVGTGAGALCGFGLVRAWQTAPSAAFLMSVALVVGYTAGKRQLSPGLVFLVLVAVIALLRRFASPVGLP
jgi:mannose/fructose/N-acetylgalactosamine-specific phosphotransferase system component IID